MKDGNPVESSSASSTLDSDTQQHATCDTTDGENVVMSSDTMKSAQEPSVGRPLEDNFGQTLTSILDQLGNLKREFATKIQFDESKQRQLDMMHQELEQHRQGMILHIMRPILMDLISLHDDLTGLLDGSTGQGPQVVNILRRQQQSVEVILSKHGVDIYSSPDDTFDRSRQRVISVVDTQDETLKESVARRRRAGFIYDGRTLRPELVETYRFRTSAD